jgi:hypothetical protein
MTIKAQYYRFGGIVLACAILISLFVFIQVAKHSSEEKAAFSTMEGYVLTSQGIGKVDKQGENLNTTIVVEKDNIVSFDLVNENTLVYSTLFNASDTTKFNIYLYDLKTKETKPAFESSENDYFLEMYAANDETVGALSYVAEEGTRKIVLLNVLTGKTETINSPSAEDYVSTWVPSPDGDSVAFKGTANDVYYHEIDTGITSVVGNFDNVYGYLNNETLWLANVEDDKKMTIFNSKSKQSKLVNFSSDLKNKVFINGELFIDGTAEKVLWLTSGFYESDIATQKLIATDGEDFETLYDLSANGYSLWNSTLRFNDTKQIMSLDAVDARGNNVILILNVSDGKLLSTLFGNQFVFMK